MYPIVAGEIRTVREFLAAFGTMVTFLTDVNGAKMDIQIGCFVEGFPAL